MNGKSEIWLENWTKYPSYINFMNICLDNVGFLQERNHQYHINVASWTSFMSTVLQTTSTVIPYLMKHLSLLLNLKLCMFKSKGLHNGTHWCSIVEFSYFLLMTVRLKKLNRNITNWIYKIQISCFSISHSKPNFIFPFHVNKILWNFCLVVGILREPFILY